MIATLHPNNGKADRVRAPNDVGVNPATADTIPGRRTHQRSLEMGQENEPGTLRYELTRDLRPGKDGLEDLVMIERHVDSIYHSRWLQG